jgi:hypothetical protein
MQVWTKNIKSTDMNQNILKNVKYIELVNKVLIVSFLIIFLFPYLYFFKHILSDNNIGNINYFNVFNNYSQ